MYQFDVVYVFVNFSNFKYDEEVVKEVNIMVLNFLKECLQ